MSASPPTTPPSQPPLPEPADERQAAIPAPLSPGADVAGTPAPAEIPSPPPTGARAQTGATRTRPALRVPSMGALLGWAALAPVLALSAVLGTREALQNGYANVFCAAGVKSMLSSLHDFLYASFDPGGLVTVDKPPLSLWVQVLSAKLFGFSHLSLLLPEAIIGVLGVAALYGALRRPLRAVGGARRRARAGRLSLLSSPSRATTASTRS